MNSPDQTSDAAWERILPQIRATRQKRAIRKIATITTLCAICGIWLGIRLTHPTDHPMHHPLVEDFPSPEVAPVTLAILRVNLDGVARLEEVTIQELEKNSTINEQEEFTISEQEEIIIHELKETTIHEPEGIELTLSLEPIIIFDHFE